MPKATKKSKEKHADFTKAKLKSGKGKKQPSNTTDTSFKARSIALPGQNNLARALATNVSEPTTAGGLTLDDLVYRLRHPNAGSRNEALHGLKDVLSGEPARQVGKVVRALGGLLSDDDASVRKEVFKFATWYLANVPESSLTPHLPLLLLQTSSALSHIFPEIRLDACHIVYLLLEHVPSHVVGSWPRTASASSSKFTGGNNILEGLRLAVMGLAGENGASVSMGKLGSKGQIGTLRAFTKFLHCALDGKDGFDTIAEIFEEWQDRKGRKGKGKGKAKQVDVTVDSWVDGWVVGVGEWGVENSDQWEIGRLDASEDSDDDTIVHMLAHLYLQLAPLLLSTFLESAPGAFGPAGPNAVDVQLCLYPATLTLILARPVLHDSTQKPRSKGAQVRNLVADFLRRMAPYFPVNQPGHSSTGMTPAFELNLTFANLMVLLGPKLTDFALPRTTSSSAAWHERWLAAHEAWKVMRISRGRGDKRADVVDSLGAVCDWIRNVLQPGDALAPQLTPSTYTALLPVIWALLVQPPPSLSGNTHEYNVPQAAGESLFNHRLRPGISVSISSSADQFIINMIQTHERPLSPRPFFIEERSTVKKWAVKWVEHVPRTLYEFGNRDEVATERLLWFLLEIGHKGQKVVNERFALLDTLDFTAVTKRFAVFFHSVHAEKGAVVGPWVKLSDEMKKLALDAAMVWCQYDDQSETPGRLKIAVTMAVGDEGWAKVYWDRLE